MNLLLECNHKLRESVRSSRAPVDHLLAWRADCECGNAKSTYTRGNPPSGHGNDNRLATIRAPLRLRRPIDAPNSIHLAALPLRSPAVAKGAIHDQLRMYCVPEPRIPPALLRLLVEFCEPKLDHTDPLNL